MAVKSLAYLISAAYLAIYGNFNDDNIKTHSRIVGGINATIEKYPFVVSLQYFGNHFCGGSIISRKWVLSAAHCFPNSGLLMEFFEVRAGTAKHKEGGKIYPVEKYIRHENFTPEFDSDIALVQIKHFFIFSDVIQTIGLPALGEEIPEDKEATVLGWGWLKEEGSWYSDVLQEVSLNVISNENCSSKIPERVTERMLCAHDEEGRRDACKGDSGGPMVYKGEVIGIVSFAPNGICASNQYPGVYTKVSYFKRWILKHIRKNNKLILNNNLL